VEILNDDLNEIVSKNVYFLIIIKKFDEKKRSIKYEKYNKSNNQLEKRKF